MKHSAKPLLLFFPFGLLSHYLRCLVLARQLSPWFRIRFAHHPKYSGFVTAEGFSTFDCKGIDEEKVMADARRFSFSWLNQEALETAFLNQAAAIEALKPIAVLGDASPTLKMASEYCSVPFVSLLNNYMTRYYAGTRNLPEKHPMAKHLLMAPENLRDSFTRIGESMAFRKIHKPFNIIRNKYRLGRKRAYLDEMEGDITVLCDLKDVFALNKLPANYIGIGPLVFDDYYKPDPFDSSLLDPNKKTIFVSMGSTGEWHNVRFLNEGVFAQFNIVTAGDTHHVLNAPHVLKLDFVAAADMFPLADLVVCHGGNGTIYQALAFGLPVLCSSSHFEQEWNVKAFEKCGLVKQISDTADTNFQMSIIKDWACRKQSAPYNQFCDKISVAVNLLPVKAGEIAAQIVNKVKPLRAATFVAQEEETRSALR